jgi:chromosome segregation ATPase
LESAPLIVNSGVIIQICRGIQQYVEKTTVPIIVSHAVAKMTTSMPTEQPVINGQDTHPVQTGIVKDFARILSYLSADKGCQGITGLVSEVDALRARNDELKSEVAQNSIAETKYLAAIRKVMNDKQELDERCSQKGAELQKAQLQASEANEKLRLALEDVVKFKKELRSTNEEVDKSMARDKKKDSLIAGLNKKVTELQDSAKQAEMDMKEAHEAERSQAKKRYEVTSQELESLRKRALPLKQTSDSALSDL